MVGEAVVASVNTVANKTVEGAETIVATTGVVKKVRLCLWWPAGQSLSLDYALNICNCLQSVVSRQEALSWFKCGIEGCVPERDGSSGKARLPVRQDTSQGIMSSVWGWLGVWRGQLLAEPTCFDPLWRAVVNSAGSEASQASHRTPKPRTKAKQGQPKWV